jgi:hypothetical protein
MTKRPRQPTDMAHAVVLGDTMSRDARGKEEGERESESERGRGNGEQEWCCDKSLMTGESTWRADMARLRE